MLLAVPSIGAAQSAPAGTAQPYPNRPVRIIVCFPPGSSPDIIARIVSNKLTSQWGQQMIVDTRPGATGIIGVEAAKNATPDGYTLLLAGATELASMPALRSKLPYDADKDFVALTRVASVAYVIAVHPSLGVNAVSDLVKLAKARPGQLNYGSSGNGSGTHIGTEMPHHSPISKPDRVSAAAGKSGRKGSRVAPVVAIILILPLFACGVTKIGDATMNWICPTIKSVIASDAPLYGTCMVLTPPSTLNISAPICVPEPLPDDP